MKSLECALVLTGNFASGDEAREQRFSPRCVNLLRWSSAWQSASKKRRIFPAGPPTGQSLRVKKGSAPGDASSSYRTDKPDSMSFAIERRKSVFWLLVVVLTAASLFAQDTQSQPGGQPAPAENSEALRKAALNPIASLISVPVQENWNFGIQPGDRIQYVLNIQPVIPVDLAKDWTLIIRWITPVIYQPVAVPQESGLNTQTGYYGLGDMQPAFFISPKRSKLIWGIGPQLLLPTATKTGVLGQEKFGLGPTAVALIQPGKWTFGALANNVWSVAGHSELPDVNQFLLQYFINYNLKKGGISPGNPP
jgi:hypothetical protein